MERTISNRIEAGAYLVRGIPKIGLRVHGKGTKWFVRNQEFDSKASALAFAEQIVTEYIDDAIAYYQQRGVQTVAVNNTKMDRKTAFSILGLNETANASEIKTKWKALMMANHPDKGGSDYMAKLVNSAYATLS